MIIDPFGNPPLRYPTCRSIYGVCTNPPIVDLKYNIDCRDMECLVDTVRVVQVTQGVFYEYVHRPCVQLDFYDNPKKIFSGNCQYAMCAKPKMAVARPACLGLSWVTEFPTHRCEYSGKREKYDTYEYWCKFMGPGPTWKQASIYEPSRFDTPSWVYYQHGYEWLEMRKICE